MNISLASQSLDHTTIDCLQKVQKSGSGPAALKVPRAMRCRKVHDVYHVDGFQPRRSTGIPNIESMPQRAW
jgi:hypothetical protein